VKNLSRKINVTHIIILLLSTLATFQFMLLKERRESDEVAVDGAPRGGEGCAYEIDRVGKYRFIKPIIDARQECESKAFLPMKKDISKQIDSFKSDGTITTASLYLEDFKQNDWINYNEGEKYDPGSLLKVPLLMAYLRMDETSPGVLNKELLFDRIHSSDKHPVFLSKAIELGKKYTVRELLRYTIAYSDNEAYALLCDNIDVSVWKKTFTDLGLTEPDWFSPSYPLTAKSYSVFLDALFNASYLNAKNSEYASELLSQCDFHEGMKRSLPDSVMVIHKFGESGDLQTKEFHESGIVYLQNSPYLLTIMTKGRDMAKLPKVVSMLSKTVFDDMAMRLRN
jgi:beta-lactamase class A